MFDCILPTVGRIRDFHSLEVCTSRRIKKKAGFLRLSQVCVRKHIPQLLFIVYSNPLKNASFTENFSISSFLTLNPGESRLLQH